MARRLKGEVISVEYYGDRIDEFLKKKTFEVAMQKLKEARRKGFDASPVVVTDKVPRRDPKQVKAFGRIEFIARPNMYDAVWWALNELIRLSPIGPVEGGHYKDDHRVLVNGVGINGSIKEALTKLKPSDKVQIVNPRAYARKLEPQTFRRGASGFGRTARRGSVQARGGVYKKVHAALGKKYGKSMFFDFTYVKLNTGVKVWGDQGGRYRKDGSKRATNRILRDQVYPCLKFFIREVDTSKAVMAWR